MGETQPSFRDRPINIDDSGSRKWIYAKKPKGKWYTRRKIYSWSVLLFLIVAPLIKVNGHAFMMLDIAHRKFILFGNTFFAQDTFILALIMLVTVIFIVLFTVVFGRLWCGWSCPQTIFLEFVFRPIEYLFDGNHRGRKQKPASPIRTAFKHITFYLVSFFFTNVFLMWFIGFEGLLDFYATPVNDHLLAVFFLMGITTFYYWIYAFFREQVCTMVCPYGRMQGVLLDSRSIAVIYDFERGEPRGVKNSGDCIDCKQCLSVCPTGIDIRNGSQLECINCTACIDECNTVMKKINKPQNLIRYDSYQGVETGKRNIFNGRTIAYSTVLTLLILVLAVVVSNRTEVETTILRLPGTMYQVVNETTIANMYNAKIVNKTNSDKDLDIRFISSVTGEIQLAGKEAFIEKESVFESIVILRIKKQDLNGKNTAIKLGLFEGDRLLESVDLNFIGPENK